MACPAGVLSPGADVQIVELVGGEQGEATPTRHTTGEVIGEVEMRRHPDLVADPQAHQGFHTVDRQRVLFAHAGEPRIEHRRADVRRWRLRLLDMFEQSAEEFVQAYLGHLEIETGEVVVVADTAADIRGSIGSR